jgi:hypothetical protein
VGGDVSGPCKHVTKQPITNNEKANKLCPFHITGKINCARFKCNKNVSHQTEEKGEYVYVCIYIYIYIFYYDAVCVYIYTHTAS